MELECYLISHFLAFRARALPVSNFSALIKLELKTSTAWKRFCHPTWDINLAHEVCRAYNFTSADEVYYEGQELDGCAMISRSKKMTHNSSNNMLHLCENFQIAAAVCKGTSKWIRLTVDITARPSE